MAERADPHQKFTEKIFMVSVGMNENRLELCSSSMRLSFISKKNFPSYNHVAKVMMVIIHRRPCWWCYLHSLFSSLSRKWRWLLLSRGLWEFSLLWLSRFLYERSRSEIISIALLATRHCGGYEFSVLTDWLAVSCFIELYEWLLKVFWWNFLW